MNGKPALLIPVCLIGIALLAAAQLAIRTEQRQRTNQLYEFQFALAKNQGAREISGFVEGKTYCLFLADYNKNRAILGEFDGKIYHDKKPSIVVLNNTPKDYLEYWVKNCKTCYGYKELP